MIENPINILKHSGETAPFDLEKLKSSLINSGASHSATEDIAQQITGSLYDGISTKEIYTKAHKLLKSHEKSKAARYGLKKAILELGPTGYPFEYFIGELMKQEGFQTETGNVMQGKCVAHEVDVLAYNEEEVHMMECKFHNRLGYKTDVKVPMYIKSRFEDLAASWQHDPRFANKKHTGWVVTNARFTKDAIDFAKCAGLRMISWDYPGQQSLKEMVTKHSLFPITTLTGLSKGLRETLLNSGITLAKTLCETPEKLQEYGIPQSKLNKIIEEAQLICER